MPNSVASFIIFLVIGFGIGFAGFEFIGNDDSNSTKTPTETAVNTEPTEDTQSADDSTNEPPATQTVAANSEIFNTKGCLSCHSVSSLDLEGGATGPDLSNAYTDIEAKHGKALNEFLKEPTSAVMSSVISGSPLTDEEIQQIVKALQEAAE